LDDHPDAGKTAIVIVPDDQLSLAIGREGQNARLAAKLTGWRIDIQSLTETAAQSLEHLDHPAVDPKIVENEELIDKVRLVLAKKEAERPVTAEDYLVLDRFVAGVEGRIIDHRALEYEAIREERLAAREEVPAKAWQLELEELNLPLLTHNLLLENQITTVGDVLYRLELGEDRLLALEDFSEEMLDVVRERISEVEPLLETSVAEEEAEAEEELAAELDVELVADAELEIVETDVEPGIAETVEEEMMVEAPAAELEVDATEIAAAEAEAVDEAAGLEDLEEAEEIEEAEAEAEEDEEDVPSIDDLSTSLVDVRRPEKKREKKGKVVIVSRPGDGFDDEDEEEDEHRKDRRLVYNEDAGRVISKRKRKRSRSRPEWEDYEDMDVDELLDDET
jgi:N utilization substance protein A